MESAFSLAAVNATYEGWWIHMDILMPLTAPYGCLKKWGEKSSPKRWIKYWNMWYHKCLRQYEKLTIHTERLPGRQESSSKVWTELKEQNITDLSIHRFDESTQMRPAYRRQGSVVWTSMRENHGSFWKYGARKEEGTVGLKSCQQSNVTFWLYHRYLFNATFPPLIICGIMK